MRKLLPYLIVLALLIGGVASLPLLLQPDRYRPELSEFLSKRLHHKVIIGKLDAGLFPPRLSLHDVSLLNPAQNAPLMQIERVDVGLSMSHLFHAAVVPETLTFDRWLASIHRKANGLWAWEEWLPSLGEMVSTVRWPLAKVEAHHGECRWVDALGANSQELVLQSVDMTMDPSRQTAKATGNFTTGPATINFQFQGQGHFLSSPAWTGILQLTDEARRWDIQCKQDTNHLQLDSQSKEWRWAALEPLLRFYSRWGEKSSTASSLRLQNLNLQFTIQAGTASFSYTGELAGGRSEMKGQILFKPTGPIARGDAAFQGVALQAVGQALWDTTAWEGTATGVGQQIEIPLSPHPWASLNGQGYMEVKEGRYHWPETLIKSLSKAHTMGYMKKKYPGFTEIGMPVRKASAHWQGRAGVISVDDGFFSAGALQAAVVGKIDSSRHGLDAVTRLQIHETSDALLKELPAKYTYKMQSQLQVQPIYGRLQGTWEAWTLRAIPARKIPAVTQAKLRRALGTK